MTAPRIGSLFTGTGAFDLAVMDVFGGEVIWHSQYEPPDRNGKEDTNQYAARILARHFPDVPNLGDITKVDWGQVLADHGPVDILTGGFPCQDVSSAGKRAGLTADSRSGLWAHMARAIHVLRPRLVVIENVEGLLSSQASGDMEPCPHCVGDGSSEPALRALGAVLGDLAALGFDAEWARVAASEIGAPHPRKRVFIYAWPAVQDADRATRSERWIAAPGQAQGGRARADLGGRGGTPAADTSRGGLNEHSELPAGRDALRRGIREDAAGRDPAAAHTDGQVGGLDQSGSGSGEVQGAEVSERAPEQPGRLHSGSRNECVMDLRPGQPDVVWGHFEPAIRRWESILGRPAPWPTDVRGRLSPVFAEWLMGLADGWVTATPGLTRNAMLRALGNGVVRRQAEAAIRLLAERAVTS